ncbi:CBS domain-containing protein [Streptomyces sp. NPDC092296]|uniref:CBS domain-containing protein n=1 Tax=Streptomyces sp. NPDC092296 TaxID=3366012 RepID=UPI0037F7AB27
MTTSTPLPATAVGGATTVGEAMEPPQLQIRDDVIVDRALDILHGAGVDHLLVRTGDGRCAGVLTRAQLAPYQARSWYTERIAVRDILQDAGPFARPQLPVTAAAVAMRARRLRAWPVVDAEGRAVGVLTVERLRAALAAPPAGFSTVA